jgi:Protein of unknown function (DUF3667)
MNIVCKNCETHFKGKFCPQCAQKASTARLKVGNVLHEFWHNFTHTDHSVFSFVKGMTLNPGLVIREFIEGKRKKYFNPYTFFLIATAILIFVTGKLFEYEDATVHTRNEFGQYTSKHYNLIIICCLPFLAFFFRLAYARYKFNYAEWITFFVFAFGFINFLEIFIHASFVFFIKNYSELNNYAHMAGYIIFVYILLSFLKNKRVIDFIGCLFGGALVWWFVEKVGTGGALWFWGMPFEKVIKMF